MVTPIDLGAFDAYMARPCVCGVPRYEHIHTRPEGRLVVLARHVASCVGFMDAIENQLGGYASENPLVARQHELAKAAALSRPSASHEP